MKATGEVMAIDRTFGVGPQQGPARASSRPASGRSPRTRAGRRRSTTSAGGLRRRPATPTSRSAGSTRRGQACESTATPSGRPRPIVLAPVPRAVRHPAVAAPRPAPPGRARGGRSAARPGSRRGSSPRWAGTSRSRPRSPRAGARLADPADAGAAELLATVKRAGLRRPRARPTLAGIDAPTRSGRPALALGLRPGLRDGRHVRRRVRRRDALLLLDVRRRRLAARGAAGRAPAALVIGSGPVRIGQGIEFDYCAVQAADTLRGPAGSAVMINSNPETVSTDFDAASRLYFEPLDPESVLERHRGRDAGRGEPLLPAFVAVRRPDAAQPRRAARRRRASRCSARPRGDRPGRGADAVRRRSLDRLGIPQPEGGMAHSVEEALTLAERIGYPVIVRPIVRDRRPGHRLRLLARRTSPGSWPRRRSSTPTGRSGSTATSRASRSTSTRSRDGERRADPGPARARRAGRRPLAATRSASSRRRRVAPGDQELDRRRRWSGSSLALGVRGLVNAQFIVREDGVYLHRGQPARVADRAVPVEGHRRADGRAGRPDRARRDAAPSWAGRAGCSRRRRSSRSRRRPSRRPSCAASTRRSGPGCSRPAR